MPNSNEYHLSDRAAETYQTRKVPAIFGPMADATLDAIALPSGTGILDVACGTGVMARTLASRLPKPCHIVGCDINDAMIDVARANTPDGPHTFEWIVAPAPSMPLGDAGFDIGFCQHGLQFFSDKPAALREIRRTLRRDAKLVITCWRAVPPFFQEIAEVLQHRLGEHAAKTAVQPFLWNDPTEIRALIVAAGFDCGEPRPLPVERRLAASPKAIRAELLATPNEQALRAAGDRKIEVVAEEILTAVERFRKGDSLVMPQVAHLFEAQAI